METDIYYERPRSVEAVQVTDENIMDVAEWATGKREFSTGEYTEEFGHCYKFWLPSKKPGVQTGVQTHAGDYLVKDFDTFYPLPAEYFERRWARS